MTSPDERQVDPLGRYWNQVAAGGPAQPDDLEPKLAETVRRLQAIGAAPTPDPAFAATLLEDLMHRAHAVPLPHPRLVFRPETASADHASAAKRPPSSIRRRSPGRWWPRLEFAAVAVLAVSLAGGLVAMNGGLPDRFGSFVALDNDQAEEPTFPRLANVAEVPTAGDGPVEVVVQRVTLEPAATWETPLGFVGVVLESGSLIQSTGSAEEDPYRMRAGEGYSADGDTAAFRNDQTESAVFLQVLIGPGVRNLDPPTGVTVEELGGGTTDILPAGPASVTFDRYLLTPEEGEDIDTGRDGLALIVVEDGTLGLNGAAGRIELSRAVGDGPDATPTTGVGGFPESVPLAAGDTALLQGGAVLFFSNESDERTSALVLTVNPGTAQTQIVSGESESVVESVYGTPVPLAPSASDLGPVATPSADAEVIDPAGCDVAPRSADSVRALAVAAPVATPTDVDGSSFRREDELPTGTPLDAETLAAVTAVERELTACLNAGDGARISALLTDAAVRAFFGEEDAAAFVTASPEPVLADEQIGLFPLRDARMLPDGRVAAIVDWGQVGLEPEPRRVSESNFHIYEHVDGRWLIAEEISTGR